MAGLHRKSIHNPHSSPSPIDIFTATLSWKHSRPLSLSMHNSLTGDLNLNPANWEWRGCISCQQTQLPPIFVKFFKWIRYATSIVMRAHGELCVSCDLIDSPTRYIMTLPSNPRPIHAGSVLFDVLIHEHQTKPGVMRR